MAKRKHRRTARALRWARNIVLGLVGLVGVLVLAAYLVFETAWGREKLRAQIEARMDAALIGGATIGDLEGNPLTELILHDVVIEDAEQRPAIRIERLTVKLPLMPLISRELRVDKIIAEKLDVQVRRLATGELNVARLTKPGPKSTWSIKLPNVEVHRGHVSVDTGGERFDLDNLELYVDAALPFAGPIDATASLSADWRQRSLPIDLAVSVHVDDEVSIVRSLVAQLGDIDMFATNVRVPKSAFSMPLAGTVAVYAPADAVHALAPTVHLPGDAVVALTATPDGRLTRLDARGAIGDSHFHAVAQADVQAKLARGTVFGEALDLATLTDDRVTGRGGVFVAFDVDANDDAELPTTRAMITAWGQTGNAPSTHAVIALHSQGEHLHAAVGAASATGLRASIEAAVHKRGERITLERGVLVAHAADVRRATQGLAPVRGRLSATLRAEGPIAPRLDLALRGHAEGRRVRVQDFSAASFRFRVNAAHVPSQPVGGARLEVVDLARGDLQLGKLTVAAGNRPDGKVQVTLRSQPKQAPWLVDLDALVTMGDTIVVDLQRHFVRAAGGEVWRGTRGKLTIGPRLISLRDFASTSDQGRVAAAATFVRAGRDAGDLRAQLDASVKISSLDKAYRGQAEASVDVTRTNGRVAGTVLVKASGIALDPESPITLDADVSIEAKADQLLASASVTTLQGGNARVVLDVDAPKDIGNPRAWRTLGRDAIRTARLTLDGVDLEKAASLAGLEPMQGRIDGDIHVTPTTASGQVRVRGVQTEQTRDLGRIAADIEVAQSSADELTTSVAARLVPSEAATVAREVTQEGAARLFATARFMAPDRLFDPAAWQRLGAGAFRGGSLRAERLAFQPGTLERLGIVSDMRGELAFGAELEPGMTTARFAVRLHQLRGGLLAKPIAASVAGVVDERSSRVVASVHANNVTLVRVTGQIPVSLDGWRADPQRAQRAPLTANATIAHVPVKTLMNVLGTGQITGGTLDGTIAVRGTVATPTVVANLIARDVSVPPESGEPTQGVKQLTLDARWDGARATVAIDGEQTAGGSLRIRAQANPDQLALATASLHARKVDLAPLVAFMPGPAGGLGGRMDASFTLRGAEPQTADLAGNLRITNGRVPIAPAVGTLFKGDVRLGVQNRIVDLSVAGKLGRGDLRVVARAPLDGVTPKSGKLTLSVNKVQLIGTTQPIMTGVVTADIARIDEQWRANMRIDRMTVKVPPEKGKKLSPVGAPNDLVYGGEKIHHGKKKGRDAPRGLVREYEPGDLAPPTQVEGPVPKRRPPDRPIVDTRIRIRNVFVESEELRGIVGGNLRVMIGDNSEVGVIGQLSLSRGVLDLFSRRYQIDKANVHFDGSTDPVLDVRITRDFPEVTTITEVRGRLSKPDLVLSSEPGVYSQAELLGFLLGGEPGGDPNNASSATERVAGAGASFLSNRVGGYVKQALPVDIDVLRYEAASSGSSAAVTVGRWVTETLFLAYRRHLEARPDENAGEGEVEYWIRRRLVLEAVVGDRGVHGVDLLWRRRW